MLIYVMTAISRPFSNSAHASAKTLLRCRRAFLSILVFFSVFVNCIPARAELDAPANDDISPQILQGIDLLYNEHFENAADIFSNLIAAHPKKPVGYFYLAMVTWSRLAAGYWSDESVEEFSKRIDRTITVAKKRVATDESDSYDYFYLGGALGFKARFKLMGSHWLRSFFLASDAVSALRTCLQIDPANRDVLFGLGVFEYYTARLSGILKWLSYLLIHPGDREEGLRKLNLAVREARYSSTEAKSMLVHIYLFLEEDFQKALRLTEELTDRYRENTRFPVLQGVCQIRSGQEADYRRTLANLRRREQSADKASRAAVWGRRALYLESIRALYHAQYEVARQKLEQILSKANSEDDPAMIAWPRVKIAMSYDLQGKREAAIEGYGRILEMDNAAGAQFLATKLLEDPLEKNDPFIGY